MNGRELRSICMRERTNLARLRFVTPIPRPGSHSLFTKRTVAIQGTLSCRESSIHRSGSLSYTDNLPEVSRACQSFLASSRQDFTHSLYALCKAVRDTIDTSVREGRDVSREADICTRRETSAPRRICVSPYVRVTSNVFPLNLYSCAHDRWIIAYN